MRKQQRLRFIVFMICCLALSIAVALYALRGNIALFRTPSDIALHAPAAGDVFKLGGMVKEGSLEKRGEDLSVAFTVTDFQNDIPVRYSGILPDLFREGQGVVATGALDAAGVFTATNLLAKHDEKYMPPEVARGLKRAQENAQGKEQKNGQENGRPADSAAP